MKAEAIQLSLFPARGFGLHVWGELLEDQRTGEPYFVRTKRAARRALATGIYPWMKPDARVVAVEVHEAVEGTNGLPTYMVTR
jgi:hypothetical protein